jgi:hypothetical protein
MTEGPQLTTLRQEANRKIILLNSQLSRVTNELYLVPVEPSVGHMTRMLDDLSSLYETISASERTDALDDAYVTVDARLIRLREYLQSRADARQEGSSQE